jgi:hypothetical protein
LQLGRDNYSAVPVIGVPSVKILMGFFGDPEFRGRLKLGNDRRGHQDCCFFNGGERRFFLASLVKKTADLYWGPHRSPVYPSWSDRGFPRNTLEGRRNSPLEEIEANPYGFSVPAATGGYEIVTWSVLITATVARHYIYNPGNIFEHGLEAPKASSRENGYFLTLLRGQREGLEEIMARKRRRRCPGGGGLVIFHQFLLIDSQGIPGRSRK